MVDKDDNMSHDVDYASPLWDNSKYKGHTMQIVESGNLFAIKHTYPNGNSGILSMDDKPRWYLIDLLLKCEWRVWNIGKH